MRVTGERATTAAGGFNPQWQRHVAEYRLAAPFLPPGVVLDLGCGVGHSYELLAPRDSVGLDRDPGALAGQDRRTVVGDMRELPFGDGEFASVLAVQSIEHVPDPERVLAEVVRVLAPGGVAVFITPNRLNFGRPDEIIDPYHYVEYDAGELRALMEQWFGSVSVQGVHGSERHQEIFERERRRLDSLLRKDPLRLRRFVPRRVRQWLYDTMLSRARRDDDPAAAAITPDDFRLEESRLDRALDLVAVCAQPRQGPPTR